MSPAPADAQLVENLGGLTDEDLPGYLEPLNKGLGGTMNAAIFRTGHVPESGFHISIGLVAAAIEFSDGDKEFLPDYPDYFYGHPVEVPTVIGDPGGAGVEGQGGLSLMFPGGFGLDGFEIAAPQISVGSFMGTRALFRYVGFDLGDTEFGQFSYYGVGAQHSVSQWIDGLPVDLAAGVFFQNFDIGDGIVDARTTQLMLTASKDFNYFQPYGGIGLDTVKIDAEYDDEDDPESSFDVALDRETDLHLTLGVEARIPYVSVFFEFNQAASTGIAVGLNIGN
jgi:hypothetical protein